MQSTTLVVHYDGKGVSQDHEEATRWYRKAAAQGRVDAQFYLTIMYRDGEGVPLDHKKRLNGLGKQQIEDMLVHSARSISRTIEATESIKITRGRIGGSGKLQTKGIPAHNTI